MDSSGMPARFGITVGEPGTDLVLAEGQRLHTRATVTVPAAGGRWGRVRLVPSASITGLVARVSPAEGYGPVVGDGVPLHFDVAWFGAADCEEDDQVFHGSLDVIVDGGVIAAHRVRITVPALPYADLVDLFNEFNEPWPDIDDRAGTGALLSSRS